MCLPAIDVQAAAAEKLWQQGTVDTAVALAQPSGELRGEAADKSRAARKKVKLGTGASKNSVPRVTLPRKRVCVDSCSSHNQMLNEECLENVHKAATVLRGD